MDTLLLSYNLQYPKFPPIIFIYIKGNSNYRILGMYINLSPIVLSFNKDLLYTDLINFTVQIERFNI